ncbi:MAG: protein kinase, partial [Gammaproteobacteria bacterium]|nr:protein kinase [Gammaproteobacteria bacterium]
MDQSFSKALIAGTKIQRYKIEKVLGRGGFGITYLARDTKLHNNVAIKEYLPGDLAVRDGTRSIRPRTSTREGDFKWGLDRFLGEARNLARFNHPNIVRLKDYFEANATAYMVMEYERGEPFSAFLNRKEILGEKEILEIIFPILDGIKALHAKRLIHRDIKPSNIIIRPDRSPVLLDFGAARNVRANQEYTVIFSGRYAPPEQLNLAGEQGPWTDIYAMGAVLYETVSWQPPPTIDQRIHAARNQYSDPLKPAVEIGKEHYSKPFLEAIDQAISFDQNSRPQDTETWRQHLRKSPWAKQVIGKNSPASTADQTTTIVVSETDSGVSPSPATPPSGLASAMPKPKSKFGAAKKPPDLAGAMPKPKSKFGAAKKPP